MANNSSNTALELDIPPAAAAVIERARKMQADGWSALKAMTDAELGEFEADLEGAYVWEPAKHGSARHNQELHPHNQARLDAKSAVTAERSRRRREWLKHESEQLERGRRITDVSEALAEIEKNLEWIAAMEPDGAMQTFKEPVAPSLDVAAATDAELQKTAQECRRIASADTRRHRENARLFGLIKSATGKKVAAELTDRADKFDAWKQSAAALLAEIEAEQARREEERRAMQESIRPEALHARISELEFLLAEQSQGGA